MEKSTKKILAIGAAGLVYFLYKKGLFANKTISEVAKEVKNDVIDVVTPDTGKKTAVELTKDCEVTYHNCTRNSRKEIIQIPIDDENCNTPMRYGGYQPDRPQCAPPLEMHEKYFNYSQF